MEIESDFENIGPFQKGWWANASINETTWNADWSIGDGVCDDYWFEKKTADMFDRNNSTYTHLYHPYLEINNKKHGRGWYRRFPFTYAKHGCSITEWKLTTLLVQLQSHKSI